MIKDEAIVLMSEGHKLTHKWFSSDEWATMNGGYVVFEDSCSCPARVFWADRTDDSWNTGWRLFE